MGGVCRGIICPKAGRFSAFGCRDALVLWGDVLIDGHNRYGICQQHGIAFQTVQNSHFKTLDDVHLWMIDQHLGRRSVSDFQRGVLALRKKEIVAARARTAINQLAADGPSTGADFSQAVNATAASELATAALPPAERLNSRESIAKAARISSATVVQIEKIQKSAAPELVQAVKAGTISINAAAAVSGLTQEEQIAAVAGGKKELQQAAKRAREGKSGNRSKAATQDSAGADSESAINLRNREAQLQLLQARVAELTAENSALKAQVVALTERLAEPG